jgi:hypothetical protein
MGKGVTYFTRTNHKSHLICRIEVFGSSDDRVQ